MTNLPRDFSHLSSRPQEDERLFHSPIVERVIQSTSQKIGNTKLRTMFEQCLPNTLDTTTYYREDEDGNPDTFIITGDIPAMWLRDSTNQLWPYLQYANHEKKLQKAFAGLIFRQTQSILTDPYANAFVDPHVEDPPKTSHWPEGEHWHPGVWERKYELDSLASFFRLSHGYYAATGDTRPFDDYWIEASVTALDVIRSEQQPLDKNTMHSMHRAQMPNGEPFPAVQNRGYGHPGVYTGMSRSLFRPSDDEAIFPYHVPSNAMAVASMRGMTRLIKNMRKPVLANEFATTSREINSGISRYGTINHPEYGEMYAYEVDGRGGQLLMDDPNVPSLLSLPYTGYCYKEKPRYQSTRNFVLSKDNPYWVEGSESSGNASPHVGEFDMAWPIGTIIRIMTSNNDAEIIECLQILIDTDADMNAMHEGVNVDDSQYYTRPWFAWANSLFGEMILDLMKRKPWILNSTLENH